MKAYQNLNTKPNLIQILTAFKGLAEVFCTSIFIQFQPEAAGQAIIFFLIKIFQFLFKTKFV